MLICVFPYLCIFGSVRGSVSVFDSERVLQTKTLGNSLNLTCNRDNLNKYSYSDYLDFKNSVKYINSSCVG
jgi:hypothetical protein